jgi:hypothetical protein
LQFFTISLFTKYWCYLSAHELQEYYPELVNGEKDGPDIQTVNYIGLINEVKTLKNKLLILEEKNEVLENKNLKLEEEVKDIKCFLNLPI